MAQILPAGIVFLLPPALLLRFLNYFNLLLGFLLAGLVSTPGTGIAFPLATLLFYQIRTTRLKTMTANIWLSLFNTNT